MGWIKFIEIELNKVLIDKYDMESVEKCRTLIHNVFNGSVKNLF